MINLKEIEAEIDLLLANETPESLRKWADNQQISEIDSYLGNGSYLNVDIFDLTFEIEGSSFTPGVVKDGDHGYTSDSDYSMAA